MIDVHQFFARLKNCKTISEADDLIRVFGLEKYQMASSTYPRISFSITKDEIEQLRAKHLINDKNEIGDITGTDALTKLLYAVLWKNGDLKKFYHIIEGIQDAENMSDNGRESGWVFYQFGRYLTKKPGEPIIDQHVIRVFGIYMANGDQKEINRLKRLSTITTKETSLITKYKHWLRTGLSNELMTERDYSYYVDRLLFAAGKSFKERQIKY